MKIVDSPERPCADSDVGARAEALLREQRERQYCRTDRLFAVLMAVQWLASIVVAYFVAPRAWEGLSSHTHPHVWAALFLGGATSLFPIALAIWYPGRTLTRHVIAVGQLLMSGLLIHLTGGRSETHFHIFGSLAFLAFYRDWRVLVTASVVTALDHVLRGLFWPQSIYGVTVVEPGRWAEHVGWVVFTDVFLMVSIRQSGRETRDIAWKQAGQEAAEAGLQLAHDRLERRVEDRTAELAQANTVLERDIAERTEMEKTLRGQAEQLRQSEARRRAVLESAPIILYAADADGTVTLSEGTGLAALGLKPGELVGRSVFEFSGGDAEVEAAMRRALAGEAVSYDSRLYGLCFHTELRSVGSEDGASAGLIGVSFDVTERVRAEEQVKDHAVIVEFQKHELEKANAELASLATTDGLTGLKNHRAFQERLAEEVSSASRYGTPLSVVFLDVDCFKQYNDTHGHPAGDAVLRAVGRILQAAARDADVVTRYGGEEFVLILPQTDLDGAKVFAERLRAAVESHRWPLRSVTASFGVAALRPGEANGAALMARADGALYASKEAGRNRVTCAHSLLTSHGAILGSIE